MQSEKNEKSKIKSILAADGIRGKTNQSLINEKFLSELSITFTKCFSV